MHRHGGNKCCRFARAFLYHVSCNASNEFPAMMQSRMCNTEVELRVSRTSNLQCRSYIKNIIGFRTSLHVTDMSSSVFREGENNKVDFH